MIRQAMSVSPMELRELADELSSENNDLMKETGIYISARKKFLVPIINKTPECSDTWEIDK